MSSISEGTFQGYVATTRDALLIFEAVRRGIMPKITRRLREDERKLIRSGTVFVFDECESGIKRWTDGLLWSPSRILNNFLVYRQIDRKSVKPPSDQPAFATAHPGFPLPNAPMDPSMAASSAAVAIRPVPLSLNSTSSEAAGSYGSYASMGLASSATAAAYSDPAAAADGGGSYGSNFGPDTVGQAQAVGLVGAAGNTSPSLIKRENEFERSLVGSLTNSYPFLKEGLCKKTISIQVQGSTQHLISYYSVEDVRNGRLRTPSSLPEIAALCISPIFLNKTNFRNPPLIEYGPDGIARYVGESVESSSRFPGHHSSGEGTSSGSDTREMKVFSSPSSTLTTYSPTAMSDPSLYDPYYRHSHQIGGSGVLPQSSSSSYPSGYTGRRSIELQPRRPAASRFEPYPSSSYYAQPIPVSSNYLPTNSNSSYYVNQNVSPLSANRKGSSPYLRNWPPGSQQQAYPSVYQQQSSSFPSGAIHTSPNNFGTSLQAQSGNSSHYHETESSENFITSAVAVSPPHQHQQAPSSQIQPAANTPMAHSAARSTASNHHQPSSASMLSHVHPKSEMSDSVFQFARLSRGSCDSNQPQPSTSAMYPHDAQQAAPVNQGLTALSLYTQSSVGGSSGATTVLDRVHASPPATSSSHDSHHSFASQANAHASLASASSAFNGPINSSRLQLETSSSAGLAMASGEFGEGSNHGQLSSDQRRPDSSMSNNYDFHASAGQSQRWQTYDAGGDGSGLGHDASQDPHPHQHQHHQHHHHQHQHHHNPHHHQLISNRSGSLAEACDNPGINLISDYSRSDQELWSVRNEGSASEVKQEPDWEKPLQFSEPPRGQQADFVSRPPSADANRRRMTGGSEELSGGLERVMLTRPTG